MKNIPCPPTLPSSKLLVPERGKNLSRPPAEPSSLSNTDNRGSALARPNAPHIRPFIAQPFHPHHPHTQTRPGPRPLLTTMAELIPTLASCRRRMTSGERRLAERLEQKLEDDYLCWYDVPVGAKRRQPDFIILHPRRGVLVLEVKDWRLETMQSVDRTSVTLHASEGRKVCVNPMLQARGYAIAVADLLRADPAMRHPPGHEREGQLTLPYGWGVVLSNITRRQFEAAQLGEVMNADHVICQDEMVEGVDAEAFQQRLWQMFSVVFRCLLTMPQIERIRALLFPEIRIDPQAGAQATLFPALGGNADSAGHAGDSPLPDLLRVMDLEQERLARSLGEGHRVIHGVAGSGKTMILGYRSVHLARTLGRPILVLCYNVALAARLNQLVAERGLGAEISIHTFHAWCRAMLVQFGRELPPSGRGFFAGLVDRVIAGVESAAIPRGQYGAVLIDEAHDFQPEWLKLVAQMVDPEINSLLVLYDDAQAIYRKEGKRRKFTFSSVGIQARGRTRILHVNYRNTWELLAVARNFAAELLQGSEDDSEEDGVPIVAPTSSGRNGPMPQLFECASEQQEAALISQRVADAIAQGTSPEQIGIVYPEHRFVESIERELRRNGIACRAADSRAGKQKLFSNPDEVKLVTMESSKGLEFNLTLIPGLGAMPAQKKDEADEARRLYVAMTRPTESLVMTYSSTSPFVERMRAAIEEAQRVAA